MGVQLHLNPISTPLQRVFEECGLDSNLLDEAAFPATHKWTQRQRPGKHASFCDVSVVSLLHRIGSPAVDVSTYQQEAIT